MIRARIALLAAAAARAIIPCTDPGDGLAPASAPVSQARRCTGTARAAIRYTHQACRFTP